MWQVQWTLVQPMFLITYLLVASADPILAGRCAALQIVLSFERDLLFAGDTGSMQCDSCIEAAAND